MERLKIKEQKQVDLEGDIEDVIDLLRELKNEDWEYISYEYEYEESEYDSYVFKTRLETDEEFEKRKEQDKILKQKKKERDLKEYLRLKNIFEKEVN